MFMSAGRSIRLFLADGSPLGLVTAEIFNWTGHVIIAPRSRLHEALARDESDRTGLYFLVGDEGGRPKVYIGEGDCISDRIKKHAKDEDKEFWERVCLVTSKDSNLTKSHVRFLESRLVEITKENGRADLVNGNQPWARLLPEADIADMEFFVVQLQLILPTLGLDFLRPKPTVTKAAGLSTTIDLAVGDAETPASSNCAIELFISHDSTGVKARAIDVDGELTVLKGAIGTTRQNAQNSYSGLRNRLIEEGRISVKGDFITFDEDIVFPSASAAAAVLNNRQSAGPREWKLASGTTLREWRDRLVDSAVR
jgi:hypothetical protein